METPNFRGSAPPKTIGAIKMKSGTNDYVGEGNPYALSSSDTCNDSSAMSFRYELACKCHSTEQAQGLVM